MMAPRCHSILNGELVGTSLKATGQIVPSHLPLQIGHDAANPDRYFNGLIDEASVYNTALNAEQIRAIHNAGSAGKVPAGALMVRDQQNPDGQPT